VPDCSDFSQFSSPILERHVPLCTVLSHFPRLGGTKSLLSAVSSFSPDLRMYVLSCAPSQRIAFFSLRSQVSSQNLTKYLPSSQQCRATSHPILSRLRLYDIHSASSPRFSSRTPRLPISFPSRFSLVFFGPEVIYAEAVIDQVSNSPFFS